MDKSLRDLFGKLSAGNPSETIDNCICLHLDNGFPMIEIHSRRDGDENAIDDDSVSRDCRDNIKQLESG